MRTRLLSPYSPYPYLPGRPGRASRIDGLQAAGVARHSADSPYGQLCFTEQPTSHYAGELRIMREGIGSLDGLVDHVWTLEELIGLAY